MADGVMPIRYSLYERGFSMRPVFLALAGTLLFTPCASADLLNDWFGVTLSVSQRTDYDPNVPPLGGNWTRYVYDNDWTPTSPTADWAVHDYNGYWSTTDITGGDANQITGGEPYDVEAIYFDDDFKNLYLAVVTSFPSPLYDSDNDGNADGGYYETRLDADPDVDAIVVPGDVALDFGLNGAIDLDDPFSYDWGVNVSNEVRQASGDATPGSPVALGTDVYQTANGDWYVGTGSFAADTPRDEMTNFDPNWTSFSGTYEGSATVSFYQYDFGGPLENGAQTWVLEVTIPFSALPTLRPGDPVSAQWVMGCRNDGGYVNNVLRVDHNITPEPGTFALCAIGLGALVGWRRRRV